MRRNMTLKHRTVLIVFPVFLLSTREVLEMKGLKKAKESIEIL